MSGRLALNGFVALVVAFVVLPIIAIVPAAFSAQRCVRHCTFFCRRPDCSSTLMCFEAAASDIGSGSANWPTVRGPVESRRRMARRVGSESA